MTLTGRLFLTISGLLAVIVAVWLLVVFAVELPTITIASLEPWMVWVGGACLVCLLVGLISYRWVLIPIRTLTSEFLERDLGGTEIRIRGERFGKDLRPLCDGINDLLHEHESMMGREEDFAHQVAHELRNPIAGIKSEIDITLKKQRRPSEYCQSLHLISDQLMAMSATLDLLVEINHSDLAATSAMRMPYKLSDLLQECWRPLSSATSERRVTVTWNVDTSVGIIGKRDKVRMVVANLMANAQRYVNSGGTIIFTTRHDRAGGAELLVSNSGSKVGDKDIANLTKRYWRGRHGADGYGIGLYLADQLITGLRGTLSFTATVGGDFTATVALPAHLVARHTD